MKKIIVHNLTFKGIEVVPGVLDFDQRGVVAAGPGDVVITKSVPDRDYLDYLQTLGWNFTGTQFITPDDTSDYIYNSIFSRINLKNLLDGKGDFYLDTYHVTEEEVIFAKKHMLPFLSLAKVNLKYGTKSGFRSLCKELSLPISFGYERMRDVSEIIKTIHDFFNKGMIEVAIKIDEGVSGAGITKLKTTDFVKESKKNQQKIISDAISKITQAGDDSGAVLEEWLQDVVASPSVQVEVSPDKTYHIVSMHDQLLEGAEKWYVGCVYPVQTIKGRLAKDILKQVDIITNHYIKEGFIGFFGLDLVITKNKKHYFVEANMRKTGTFYPRVIAEKASGGSLENVYYIARDFTVGDFIGRSFKEVKDRLGDILYPITLDKIGVVLYNIVALKEAGRFDVVCIGRSRRECRKLYHSLKKYLKIK